MVSVYDTDLLRRHTIVLRYEFDNACIGLITFRLLFHPYLEMCLGHRSTGFSLRTGSYACVYIHREEATASSVYILLLFHESKFLSSFGNESLEDYAAHEHS